MAVTHRGRTFDWIARFDERSLQYRAAPRATTLPTGGRIWRTGRVTDQGAEGACVGHGCAAEAAATPARVPGADTNDYATAWYKRAQYLDEWAGQAYDGTSVLAGCLVGRERGCWTGFTWAKSAEEFAAAIVAKGPGIAGVTWREDSYDTDALGVLRATGPVVGGHCILVHGYVPERPSAYMRTRLSALGLLAGFNSIPGAAFIIQNSWSPSYGKGGRAIVPVDVMRGWVRDRAELAVPIGRRIPRAA
jgi:hypothetical protein